MLRRFPGRSKLLLMATLAMFMIVVAMSSSVSTAQAHETCKRDNQATYFTGLSHIHQSGTELWQVNTAKSSFGGPGAYLVWQIVNFFTPWKLIEEQGTIWCPEY
jgi:hypothetical protein